MSVTIHDVAKAADVSTATVSNVLNKTGKVGSKTRRLVLSTVRRLGYIRDVHARHLASREQCLDECPHGQWNRLRHEWSTGHL